MWLLALPALWLASPGVLVGAFHLHRLLPPQRLGNGVGATWGQDGGSSTIGGLVRGAGGAFGAGLPRPWGALATRIRAAQTLAPPRRRMKVPSYDEKPSLKLGVLLLQLGGPERADDVEGFLYNLFADPGKGDLACSNMVGLGGLSLILGSCALLLTDIIRLPGLISGLQKPLAYFISKRRAPKSRAAYESIGGGSPIVRYTRAQATGVETLLKDAGLDAKCYVAMRYWHPFTEEALEEMKRDGIDTIVVVPLYPQFSISTSGSSLRVLQDLFFKDSDTWGRIRHTVVPAWYDRPGYVRAMGRLIQKELDKFAPEERALGPLHVLFSAHGVPQRYIDLGDPYKQQIEHCVELIAREYSADVTTHLSYQSRVGPVEWLRPYTDDKLEELGESGVKNLVVVPISFVSEHIETLEEIDMEYRELAYEKGIVNWRRVPALNTEPEFIADLAEMVVEALQEPTISITEACALNNLDIESEPRYQMRRAAKSKEGASRKTEDDPMKSNVAMLAISGSVLLDLITGQGFHNLMQ
jgi:protoporphyrin/coproporphyrin ferrochelatase